MAFGIDRQELMAWKEAVENGHIAFLTHYWLDDRFPGCKTVTKVGCSDLSKLIRWGERYGLKPEWIDHRKDYPHYDLFGRQERTILEQEGKMEQLHRFYPEIDKS